MRHILKTINQSEIKIDDLGNVILQNEFDLVLGKINEEYRFVPNGITLRQGLTPEILDIIASLIRKKAGIGEKKAEAINETEEESK